jgi:phage shock protein E
MTPIRGAFPLPFALILLLVSTVSAAEHTTDSIDTVKKNLAAKKAVIVDVREKAEWEDGHLEDALHAPLSELKMAEAAKRFVSQLPDNKIVYTHCAAGVRSVSAAKILRAHGVEVRPLKPGYDELIKAGFNRSED